MFNRCVVRFREMFSTPYTPASGGQAAFFFASLEKCSVRAFCRVVLVVCVWGRKDLVGFVGSCRFLGF